MKIGRICRLTRLEHVHDIELGALYNKIGNSLTNIKIKIVTFIEYLSLKDIIL